MELHSIDDLIEALAPDGAGGPSDGLKRAWKDGSLMAWLEVRAFHFGALDAALLDRLRDLAKRLSGDADLGLFALLQTLQPDRPLQLVAGVSVDGLEQIEAAIAANPRRRVEMLAALTRLASGGRLAEWARATQCAGWRDLLKQLQALPSERIDGIQHLPGYSVRWYASPRAPFPAGDTEVENPAALAAWIDLSPEHRQRGLKLLESGWLDLWLASTGRLSEPRALDGLRRAPGSSQARVEMLLRLLDPARPPAQVQVEPAKLNVGDLSPGDRAERSIMIKTLGKGYAWGACALEGDTLGMRVDPLSFDGTPAKLTLTVDSAGVAPFTQCQATLVVSCFDGRAEQTLRIPVRYRVRVPLADKIGRSILAGAVVGGGMALLRLVAGSTLTGPNAAAAPLDWVPMAWVGALFDRSLEGFIGVAILGLALLGALIGTWVYLARVCRR